MDPVSLEPNPSPETWGYARDLFPGETPTLPMGVGKSTAYRPNIGSNPTMRSEYVKAHQPIPPPP